MAEALPGFEDAVASVAGAFAYVGRMFVIGRGIEFATAREIALKLTETCRVAAEPLTSTDLGARARSPHSIPLFPVWTIASKDEALPTIVEAARRARAGRGDAGRQRQRALGDRRRRVPSPRPRGAVAALVAAALRSSPASSSPARWPRRRASTPDHPVGLTKVTLAQ